MNEAETILQLAKQKHNSAFRRAGGLAWVLGVCGFLPSSILAIIHGVIWSVSHNQPHTQVDNWLRVHAVAMWVFLITAALQFLSGGRFSRKMKSLHRYSGYVSFCGHSVGML